MMLTKEQLHEALCLFGNLSTSPRLSIKKMKQNRIDFWHELGFDYRNIIFTKMTNKIDDLRYFESI